MPIDPVDIVETSARRSAAVAGLPERAGSLALSGRPAPSAGQLLRVGLLLAIAALCAGALKAGLGRTVAGADRTASPQTSGGALRA
ncbi:hypothetical protein IY145_20800 [Methylosinus sp. H3A]|uniref:hypothetical protein n=1 Tax=Methylosinus sp. H3A TaxID=2785786 RepID=UPI0018C2CCEC|nr:hypothetical protein [Methylosinus sp. H3A]MBG0811791.1 hypothetical protein [Methylosinus sp. H3A]